MKCIEILGLLYTSIIHFLIDVVHLDLYDNLFMPKNLQKAHQKLDSIIEKIYTKHNFTNDNERIAFLIKLYHENIN